VKVSAAQWLAFVDTLVVLVGMFGLRIVDTVLTCIGYTEVRGVLWVILPYTLWGTYSIYADFKQLLRISPGGKNITRWLILRVGVTIFLTILYFPLMLVLWDSTSWVGA